MKEMGTNKGYHHYNQCCFNCCQKTSLYSTTE